MTGFISLHQWQVIGFPAGNATAQLGGGVTSLEQLAADSTRLLAHCVDDDQGLCLVLFQLAQTVDHFVLRNVDRADDMTCGVFLGRADVEDQALVSIDQSGQLAIAQALAATTDFIEQQQDQQNNEDRNQDVVICRELNQVSNHQRCSRRLKMSASIHSPLITTKARRAGGKATFTLPARARRSGDGTNIRRRWRICPKMRVFIIFEQP